MKRLLVALIAVAALTGASAASADMSDWFGGSTIQPEYTVGEVPAPSWCRDIDVWHSGHGTIGTDYRFHLYGHVCGKQVANGNYVFTTVRLHTGLTNTAGTAHYDGVYEKQTNYYTCQVGPLQKWEMRGCLHVVRKAQITHHLPGLGFMQTGVGHAVVAFGIDASGDVADVSGWPYWSLGQW